VPIEFLTPGGIAKNIALGLDGQDRLLVAWLDMSQDLIYYQLSSDQGQTWSPPRPIPGVWVGGLFTKPVSMITLWLPTALVMFIS